MKWSLNWELNQYRTNPHKPSFSNYVCVCESSDIEIIMSI